MGRFVSLVVLGYLFIQVILAFSPVHAESVSWTMVAMCNHSTVFNRDTKDSDSQAKDSESRQKCKEEHKLPSKVPDREKKSASRIPPIMPHLHLFDL